MNIRLNSKDVYNENPAEKLNYHVILNDKNNKYNGAIFGHPSCVVVWDTQLLGVSSLQVGSLFKPDGVLQASDCAQREPGRLHFHSHLSPLDVKFNSNATSVHIAFHGSWKEESSHCFRLKAHFKWLRSELTCTRNRNSADGYRLRRVDFKNGQPVAD